MKLESDKLSGCSQPANLKQIAFKIFELGHGYRTCAEVLGLSIYTVREWYALYKFGSYDPELICKKPVKAYSEAFREKVVRDYLATQPTISELSRRYDVSKRTLKRWIDAAESAQMNSATK